MVVLRSADTQAQNPIVLWAKKTQNENEKKNILAHTMALMSYIVEHIQYSRRHNENQIKFKIIQ